MTISIIIPAFNEREHIGDLVRYLREHGGPSVAEIIVSDGSSTDGTAEAARKGGALAYTAPKKGRAAQMNYGASRATGDVLYFVHADSYPPHSFAEDIRKAVGEGYSLGRYRTRFRSSKRMLRFNEWFTRFDLFICMGGDQTLFVTRTLFDTCGGFDETMLIMEEYAFCRRARQEGRYVILNGAALISARKYDRNSWWEVQKANYTIVRMYKKGAAQSELASLYKKMLRW